MNIVAAVFTQGTRYGSGDMPLDREQPRFRLARQWFSVQAECVQDGDFSRRRVEVLERLGTLGDIAANLLTVLSHELGEHFDIFDHLDAVLTDH